MIFGRPVSLCRSAGSVSRRREALRKTRRVLGFLQERSIQRGHEPRPDGAERVSGHRGGLQVGCHGGEVIGVPTLGCAEPIDVGRIGDHGSYDVRRIRLVPLGFAAWTSALSITHSLLLG